jgi:uncharacterized protein YoxC
MTAIAEKISQELDELKRLRDELRVQIHLGTAETRDLWEKTEQRFAGLETRLKELKREVKGPLQDVGEATRYLLDEIGNAYRQIRKAL